MTTAEIYRIALEQSALDYGCAPEDFVLGKNLVVPSLARPEARKYLPLPFALDMTCYGANIVAQTSAELAPVAREYIDRYPAAHAFETPHIHKLNEMLAPYGYAVCFMAEYFLPEAELLREFDCPYELRLLYPQDFAALYLPEWSDALCEKRKELDVLAVGAYDGERLVGLAGCSADCERMYQIGVNVLPEYRGRGVAAAVTSCLTREIFALGKVPFYCAAWCNIPSVRNALKCGFRPAWNTLTARPIEFVAEMNQ